MHFLEFTKNGRFLFGVTECGMQTLLFSIEQQMTEDARKAWRERCSKEERLNLAVEAIFEAVDTKAVEALIADRLEKEPSEVFVKCK